jgi:hypothetical protein
VLHLCHRWHRRQQQVSPEPAEHAGHQHELPLGLGCIPRVCAHIQSVHQRAHSSNELAQTCNRVIL